MQQEAESDLLGDEDGWFTPARTQSVLRDIFARTGSVFPFAACFAVPAGLLTCLLKGLYFYHDQMPEDVQGATTWIVVFLEMFRRNEDGRGGSTTNAYGTFLFILGFLSVFRTSQAYGRFWDGATMSHGMLANWWESFSYFAAFSNPDLSRKSEVAEFRELLARLYSILSAVALATLRGREFMDRYRLEVLLDSGRVDKGFIETLMELKLAPEVVIYWIQSITADAVRSKVVDMPPPIVSRAYQELGKGMNSFKDAAKTASLPFPFPYSQTTLILLIIHVCITPFVMVFWTKNIATAGLFCGAQVLIFWMLHAISLELENPFGCDKNDLPLEEMQSQFNKYLLLLMDPKVQRVPELMPEVLQQAEEQEHEACWAEASSFVFELVPSGGESPKRQRTTTVRSASSVTALTGNPPSLSSPGSTSPRSTQRSPPSQRSPRFSQGSLDGRNGPMMKSSVSNEVLRVRSTPTLQSAGGQVQAQGSLRLPIPSVLWSAATWAPDQTNVVDDEVEALPAPLPQSAEAPHGFSEQVH